MTKAILYALVMVLPLGGMVAQAGDKHVVELFTSQSCYSCPPAERLLGKLVKTRADVVALEFHVDYWNDLVYGLAGKWVDLFSDSVYTQRQQRYRSRNLRGNEGIYTPQAVVDGRAAVVGSNRQALVDLLAAAPPRDARVVLQPAAAGLRVMVSGERPGPSVVWLYTFDRRKVTEVNAGENKGKTLVNYHVVRGVRRIGDWDGTPREWLIEDLTLTDGQGCAVVVQRASQGPVLGAELCPS